MNRREKTIEVPVGKAIELLAILEEGVVGFDRIRTFGREAGEREYGRVLIAFLEDRRRFGSKLARARRIVVDAVDAAGDAALTGRLEEALRAVPDWTEGEESRARGAEPVEPPPPDTRSDRANP